MQRLERGICLRSVLNCGSRIKGTVKFETKNINWLHGGCDGDLPPRKAWFDSPEKPNISSIMATKLERNSDEGGRETRWPQECEGY